jgi:hypothetical protein
MEKEIGKIKLVGDGFRDENTYDGRYQYEFVYDSPGLSDDDDWEIPSYSKKHLIEHLVKNFAIKLRVNILKESEDKFDENSSLKDVLNFDEFENSLKSGISTQLDVNDNDNGYSDPAVEHQDDSVEMVEKTRFEIEARIEFDIDSPFIIDAENRNEAIKEVVKYCTERFNIPAEAVVFKSVLTEDEKLEREEIKQKNEVNG